MISSNKTDVLLKDEQRYELAAAMLEFERNGGEVQSLGTYGIKPKDVTWRNDGFSLPNSSQNSLAENRELALLERVKGLIATGAGHTSIAKSLGTNGRATLDRLVAQYDLKIASAYTAGELSFQARRSRQLQQQQAREKLANTIRPMLTSGYSRNKIAMATGSCKRTINKVINEFKLEVAK